MAKSFMLRQTFCVDDVAVMVECLYTILGTLHLRKSQIVLFLETVRSTMVAEYLDTTFFLCIFQLKILKISIIALQGG